VRRTVSERERRAMALVPYLDESDLDVAVSRAIELVRAKSS
jgi:hypothetical protein